MHIKFNLNKILEFISNNINKLFFMIIVLIFTNFLWWIIKPAKLNVLHNVLQDDFNNQVSQNIVNRAPFGIIVKKVDTVEEKSSENVVVSGIYAADKNDSIAFISLNGSSIIAKIGDTVGSSTLTDILPNYIILSTGDSKRTINMSSGDAVKNDVQTASNNQVDNNNHQDTSQNQYGSNNNNNAQQNDSSTHSGSNDDIIAQRKKMIEQFQKQNSDNN